MKKAFMCFLALVTVPIDSPYNTFADLLNAAKTKDVQIGNGEKDFPSV